MANFDDFTCTIKICCLFKKFTLRTYDKNYCLPCKNRMSTMKFTFTSKTLWHQCRTVRTHRHRKTHRSVRPSYIRLFSYYHPDVIKCCEIRCCPCQSRTLGTYYPLIEPSTVQFQRVYSSCQSCCLKHVLSSWHFVVAHIVGAVILKRELNLDKKWQSDYLFYIIMNEIRPRFNQFWVILKIS